MFVCTRTSWRLWGRDRAGVGLDRGMTSPIAAKYTSSPIFHFRLSNFDGIAESAVAGISAVIVEKDGMRIMSVTVLLPFLFSPLCMSVLFPSQVIVSLVSR